MDLTGLVIRSQAGYLTVRTEKGDIICRMRGRLRRGRAEGDRVAVGDRVRVSRNADGSGNIEEVFPRERVLSRALSGVNYEYEQIICSQTRLVFSIKRTRLRMLTVFCHRRGEHIPAIIGQQTDSQPSQAEGFWYQHRLQVITPARDRRGAADIVKRRVN